MSSEVVRKRSKRGSGSEETASAPSSATSADQGGYDLTADATPPEWLTAEYESPQGRNNRPLKRKQSRLMPKGKRASAFTSTISALVACLIGGIAWYWLDALAIYEGPWIAIPVGILVAVFVRIGSGGDESAFLAALSITSYLLTLMLVLLLITRRELGEIYDSVGGFAQYENHLVRTRLQQPTHLLAYGLGALAAVQVTFLLRQR